MLEEGTRLARGAKRNSCGSFLAGGASNKLRKRNDIVEMVEVELVIEKEQVVPYEASRE